MLTFGFTLVSRASQSDLRTYHPHNGRSHVNSPRMGRDREDRWNVGCLHCRRRIFRQDRYQKFAQPPTGSLARGDLLPGRPPNVHRTQPLEPILFPMLRIYLAVFPCLHCSKEAAPCPPNSFSFYTISSDVQRCNRQDKDATRRHPRWVLTLAAHPICR